MKIQFQFSPEDCRSARAFFDARQNHSFVKARHRRNVEGERAAVCESEFWEALVSALLTSRQRSGPGSAVNRFISATPFPLQLVDCQSRSDTEVMVLDAIRQSGGIRFGPTIAKSLAMNLKYLERDGWSSVLPLLRELEASSCVAKERAVAAHLSANLRGIGPKQSRNVLQMLGLTKYEIPLDSRVVKWLNSEVAFPIRLNSALLSEEAFYQFVSDAFQALCREVDVLPCLMDAAIFASFDKQQSDSQTVRW